MEQRNNQRNAFYTVRGEAAIPLWGSTGPGSTGGFEFANGFSIPLATSGSNQTAVRKTGSVTFDTVRAVQLGNEAPTPTSPCQPSDVTGSFESDAAFRVVGYNSTNSMGSTYSRTFDNEDLTVSQIGFAMPGLPGDCQKYKLQYAWGAKNHPIKIGGAASWGAGPDKYGACEIPASDPPASQLDSLHWDGDTLLFTTNSYGQLDDLKIDSSADYTPSNGGFAGVTVWGRTPDGTPLACHNTTSSGWILLASQYRELVNDVCQGATSQKPIGPTMAVGDGLSVVGYKASSSAANSAIVTQPGGWLL